MTMTPITPELMLHTHQDNDGIYINSLIMKHRGNNYHLYAGSKVRIPVDCDRHSDVIATAVPA